MSEFIHRAYQAIDDEYADKPAATRRQLVAGAAATLGSMGALSWAAENAQAQGNLPSAERTDSPNRPENIVNIAATAEVLATIVNTVGAERVNLEPQTRANIQAAAYQELIHYQTLVSPAVGATPLTKRIWVPDAVFSNAKSLLTTLVVGDQVFINAYLLAGTVFARAGGLRGSQFARYSAEFMGVEAVHRAIALQAMGFPIGNDRAFMKFAQREPVPGLPTTGQPGFYRITDAVTTLQAAGFGFGEQGAGPGAFYDFDEVARRTPTPANVNIRSIS